MITGFTIYPHRPDLYDLIDYQCPHCKNYVGTHKGGKKKGQPLGSIPFEELKRARIILHRHIDALWQKRLWKRGKLYKRIATELGITEYHTGEIRTMDEARQVYRIVQKIVRETNKKGGKIGKNQKS